MDFLSNVPAGGTLFNAVAIVVCGSVGVIAGRFIPEQAGKLVFQCLGLFCLYIGVSMAIKTQNDLVVMFSLLTGAVAGAILDIEGMLERLGDNLKRRFDGGGKTGNFTQAFMTASILFCAGSMSVIGAIENGINGSPSLLLFKGCLDGASSLLLAASMGAGVIFAALPILVYQGLLTFAAQWLNTLITPSMLDNLSGLGGIIIIALGLNILEISSIKTSNLVPGVVFVLLLSAFV